MAISLTLLFIISGLCFWLLRLTGARLGTAAALIPFALFVWFILYLPDIGSGFEVVEDISWVPSLGVSLTFRLDGFSLLFTLLVTGIGTLVVLYANAYFADAPATRRASFIGLILLFMAAMLGTVWSDHLIGLYVFWELTSLFSYLIIGFDAAKKDARKAALQSLIVTAGGGLALFGGILLIGLTLDTWSLSQIAMRGPELAASPLAPAILVLVLIGAFTKSAQFPFHFWLPNAMAAPTPASAFLHSATMVKLGVYLLARLDAPFSAMPAFGPTLVFFGALTLLVAALRALMQGGFKAILAQSTVGSLGLLVMLIGLGGTVASVAVVTFILAHALYKAALFFCAGTAIHATHQPDILAMRGLSRRLPLTATACVLAALAMAGLPPLFAFIAKETIFEAMLGDRAGYLLLVAAVVGNAAFVMIGLTAALRPFLLGSGAPSKIYHGESPGLVAGPLLLGAAGFLFGLFPNVAEPLTNAAATAIAGQEVAFSLYLWHGVTPMLMLSLAVVALGVLLYLAWPLAVRRLGSNVVLARLLGDAGYNRLFEGTLALARLSTRMLQNGDQHRYTAIVLATVLAVSAGTLVLVAPSMQLDLSMEGFRLAPTAVLILMVAGGMIATRVRSLLTSVVSMGMIGFGSALIFLLNGAPDLALTQFSVEVLIVLILTALLLRTPVRLGHSRTRSERVMDAAMSVGFGLLLFAGLLAMTGAPLDLSLSEFYGRASYAEAYGRNVVNVILVDFRALDTMGEIAVICLAAIGVWGMLRVRGAHRRGKSA
ncbi:DUF4040 domain-containing protein [Aureimonas altamirensis]|uniref:hydrogen gas-evolving membrane-bound hydrogenase subunit E n=1 Tax=Aureimonas TaxID=414371 RepID=UPI0019D60ED5|nr:hydrogen gas-evolving membrane-bound hydrogenase subunit E [Aureimonas sp. OT7]MCM2504246.1 DUF4040 domain-containing protein [Aureimonas altamirensis]